MLPKALSRRSRFGTPTLALLLSCLGIFIMVTFDFLQIVEMLNVVYCLAELLEFAAFLKLRLKHPHLQRPFQVPLPTWGLALMLLPASLLLIFIISNPFISGDVPVISFTLGSVAVACLLYPLLRAARRRGWCEFHDVEEHAHTWEAIIDDEVDSTDDRIGSWATGRVVTNEDGSFSVRESSGFLESLGSRRTSHEQ